MKNKFKDLKEKIIQQIKNSPIEEDPSHSLNTLEWVLKIEPNASEALQIAALAHDIERSVSPRVKQREGEGYDEKKQRHSVRSAGIIKDMMEEVGFDEPAINRVYKLVLNHEVGGWDEVDILQDADSISYFDNGFKRYLKRHGRDVTVEKSKWMYDRSSKRAQEYIQLLSSYKEIFV